MPCLQVLCSITLFSSSHPSHFIVSCFLLLSYPSILWLSLSLYPLGSFVASCYSSPCRSMSLHVAPPLDSPIAALLTELIALLSLLTNYSWYTKAIEIVDQTKCTRRSSNALRRYNKKKKIRLASGALQQQCSKGGGGVGGNASDL